MIDEGKMLKSVPESRIIPWSPKLVEASRMTLPFMENSPMSWELMCHHR
jgi:hypothetical protein